MKVPPTEVKKENDKFKSKWCYWTSFLGPQLLGDYKVINRLTSIDPSGLSVEIMKELELLIKEAKINEARTTRASVAARGLYQWVNAVRNYYFVYQGSTIIRDRLVMADLQVKKYKEKKSAIAVEVCAL